MYRSIGRGALARPLSALETVDNNVESNDTMDSKHVSKTGLLARNDISNRSELFLLHIHVDCRTRAKRKASNALPEGIFLEVARRFALKNQDGYLERMEWKSETFVGLEPEPVVEYVSK
ncbi:unnamed protein product [Caenorhabditis sp. 36 PRJEB53466]|nr:unnamed protein product [Caenorhabditis sp. 36 PRJEB53466]